MNSRLSKKESDSVTILAIISALTAGVFAKLWHVEYFVVFSVAFVLVFTGFAFRSDRAKRDTAKELSAIWVSGAILYVAAAWLWR